MTVGPAFAGGPPALGVVADGSATLRLDLSAGPTGSREVVVERCVGGTLHGSATDSAPLAHTFSLGSGGKTTVYFRPLPYLPDDRLVPVAGTGSPTWAMPAGVTFRFGTEGGTGRLASVSLRVCRPPLLLVHGFTGSTRSLASFSAWLDHERFDTFLADYYNTDPNDLRGSGIEPQADKLASHVAAVCAHYRRAGYRIERVDLVAHSMGGLIARRYLYHVARNGRPSRVRKLVMLAVPNHGVAWVEKVVGNLLASLLEGKHQFASDQLYSGHSFFRSLNAGEADGRHLLPDVQYAVIVGLRSRYPLIDIEGSLLGNPQAPADDDGVVERGSAQLNGVTTYHLPVLFHTWASELAKVFPSDQPLNHAPPVIRLVKHLLLRDIPRPRLAGTDLVLARAVGEVFLRRTGDTPWQPVASWPLALRSAWAEFRTAEGRALIELRSGPATWGTIALPPAAELQVLFSGPHRARVCVVRGQAVFETGSGPAALDDADAGNGGFEVLVGAAAAASWTAFTPRARLVDTETRFVVGAGASPTLIVLDGRVTAQNIPPGGARAAARFEAGSSVVLPDAGGFAAAPFPETPWWNDPFFRVAAVPAAASSAPGIVPPLPASPEAYGRWEETIRDTCARAAGLLAESGLLLEEGKATARPGQGRPEANAAAIGAGRVPADPGLGGQERAPPDLAAAVAGQIRVAGQAQGVFRHCRKRADDLPLPLRLGLEYFEACLETVVRQGREFARDDEALRYLWQSGGSYLATLCREMREFGRLPSLVPLAGHRRAKVSGQLARARASLAPWIGEVPPAPAGTWEKAYRQAAQAAQAGVRDLGLAEKALAGSPPSGRLLYAVKGLKARLRAASRDAWEASGDDAFWRGSFEALRGAFAGVDHDLASLAASLP
ncbi:MAG: alpha/beta fold hydrolase [Candidatus Riflebacteria bacterium]|nr:alpha/beta fold hydrolase [Candidatus Riflebacteria bacterium]